MALTIVETLSYQGFPVSSSKEENHKKGNRKQFPKQLTLDYQLQPGRLSIFAGKCNSILFDSTYNASPLSMRKTIDTVHTIRSKLFPKSEIRLILGDMRELGDLTEKEHRLLAGYVSQTADKLFLL